MRQLNRCGKVALLAGLAVLLGTGSAAFATEAGTLDKALAQAKAEDKLVVIDFYTDW